MESTHLAATTRAWALGPHAPRSMTVAGPEAWTRRSPARSANSSRQYSMTTKMLARVLDAPDDFAVAKRSNALARRICGALRITHGDLLMHDREFRQRLGSPHPYLIRLVAPALSALFRAGLFDLKRGRGRR